jgi:hypothetical protein
MVSEFNGQTICSVRVFIGSVEEGMLGPVYEFMTEMDCWPVRYTLR